MSSTKEVEQKDNIPDLIYQFITTYLPYGSTQFDGFRNTKADGKSIINIKFPENIFVEVVSELDIPYRVLSVKIEKRDVESAGYPQYSFFVLSDLNNTKLELTMCDTDSSHNVEYSMITRHKYLPGQTFNMTLLDYAYPTSEDPTLLSSTELYGVKSAISHCHCSYGVRYFERDNIHPRKYALDKTGIQSGMNRIIYLTNNKAKSAFYGSINCPDTAQSLYAALIGLGYSNDDIMPFLSFLNDHLAYPKLMEKLWNCNGKNGRTLWTNIQSIVASKQAEQGIHFSPVSQTSTLPK